MVRTFILNKYLAKEFSKVVINDIWKYLIFL